MYSLHVYNIKTVGGLKKVQFDNPRTLLIYSEQICFTEAFVQKCIDRGLYRTKNSQSPITLKASVEQKGRQLVAGLCRTKPGPVTLKCFCRGHCRTKKADNCRGRGCRLL